MADLPRWVWDLVADLLDEEDVHPKLYFTSGGFVGYRQYDWCPAKPLERVPDDVKAHAAVVASYRHRVAESASAEPDPADHPESAERTTP